MSNRKNTGGENGHNIPKRGDNPVFVHRIQTFPAESLKGRGQEMYIYFKEVLNERKRNLLALISQTRNSEVTEVEAQRSNYAEIATVETERAFRFGFWERERKLIKEIDRAIVRIDEERFGICGRCGEEIELERLKARPVATYCIHCKTRQEKESGVLQRHPQDQDWDDFSILPQPRV